MQFKPEKPGSQRISVQRCDRSKMNLFGCVLPAHRKQSGMAQTIFVIEKQNKILQTIAQCNAAQPVIADSRMSIYGGEYE
ncbi:MAG: hypothetical protein KDK39_16675 [Leptospiraceae bacterium]|nr:hypothetical protein [Leptospiraceae bacterium]